MRVEKIYNKISQHYHDFDYNNVMTQCNQIALQHIQSIMDNPNLKNHIVDLGVGDGRFLKLLHQNYPEANLTGVDISENMLNLAKQAAPFQAIHSDLCQASQHLPHHSFELASSNFVCAYVGIDGVLKQAQTLLKPKGIISITTSTLESFTNTQQQLENVIKKRHSIKAPFAKHISKATYSTLVPANQQTIIKAAEQYGFNVVHCQTFTSKINFASGRDFLNKAIGSGWIASLFQHSWIPSWLMRQLVKLFVHLLSFPYSDQCLVEIVLLQKKD